MVGVVPDTRWRDLREARPSIYFPLRQSFFPFAPTSLAIRTDGDPAALVPAVRRAIEAAAPGVALASAAPFERFLERPLAEVNTIVLHIGNGVSACAVRGGHRHGGQSQGGDRQPGAHPPGTPPNTGVQPRRGDRVQPGAQPRVRSKCGVSPERARQPAVARGRAPPRLAR